MDIAISSLKSITESNLFLRCIWAELRKEFGRVGWFFSPYKQGEKNRIHFGMMGIGDEKPLDVSISYKQKGIVSKLHFDSDAITIELEERLRAAVKRALASKNETKRLAAKVFFNSPDGMISSYVGKYFSIYPVQKKVSAIQFEVKAFDEIDAQTEFQKLLFKILDFISICTNSSFVLCEEPKFFKIKNPGEQVYFEDDDWMDGHPAIKSRLGLTKLQCDLIDQIISGDLGINHPILRASTHFHLAQKQDDSSELAIVLYVSALEVATNIENQEKETCKKCGQVIYSIRHRVLDLVKKHANGLEYLFDNYYSMRSKYLHAGILHSDLSYAGNSIPLLAPGSENDVRQQVPMPSINVKEYTGYILRKMLISDLYKRNES